MQKFGEKGICVNNYLADGNNKYTMRKRKDTAMDKKFNFSDPSTRAKILYAAVIAILTVTAIVIGIVAAANKGEVPPAEENVPPASDSTDQNGTQEGEESENSGTEPDGLQMIMPVDGSILKGHSTEVPVFSTTLGEWRIHTGMDIAAEEGSKVVAAADGKVTKAEYDPFLGQTVVIEHEGGVCSVYSNLSKDLKVKVGEKVTQGEQIGTVGDTSLTELADEAHLHFEVTEEGASVNPLDYLGKN